MIKKISSLFFKKNLEQNVQALIKSQGLNIDITRIRVKNNIIKLIIDKNDISSAQQALLFNALKKEFPFAQCHLIEENQKSLETPAKKNPHNTLKAIRPENFKKIIIVASGKGGVGKSAISLNLARHFKAQGLNVAYIDCDIYGPSGPTMTGGNTQAEYKNNKLQPIIRDGIKTMSIGYMVAASKAIIWRGPMLSGAINQIFQETDWGSDVIDIAIVDMPPGTGDAQLTICQNLSPDSAIIVSQPQMISIIDAERCAMMFEKLNVPILGVIENMSGFVAPDTGKIYYIFGQGGAEAFAKARQYDFLGALPIVPMIAYASDQGINPITLDGCTPFNEPLNKIANKIIKQHVTHPMMTC